MRAGPRLVAALGATLTGAAAKTSHVLRACALAIVLADLRKPNQSWVSTVRRHDVLHGGRRRWQTCRIETL
jgi:hypothetical protein